MDNKKRYLVVAIAAFLMMQANVASAGFGFFKKQVAPMQKQTPLTNTGTRTNVNDVIAASAVGLFLLGWGGVTCANEKLNAVVCLLGSGTMLYLQRGTIDEWITKAAGKVSFNSQSPEPWSKYLVVAAGTALCALCMPAIRNVFGGAAQFIWGGN